MKRVMEQFPSELVLTQDQSTEHETRKPQILRCAEVTE